MEYEKLKRLIKEDNVDELAKIINHNSKEKNHFNILQGNNMQKSPWPLLLIAVKNLSQKVLEYLLPQDFIDKTVSNALGENIYHVICSMRGAEHIFSLIQNNAPHNLLLKVTIIEKCPFQIACEFNNLFIVKSLYNILKTLKTDLNLIINNSMGFIIKNKDIEVIKFILSIDGIKLTDDILFIAIQSSNFDLVVCLLNFYICQSIPFHLHHLFNIFHFVNHPLHYNNNNNFDEQSILKWNHESNLIINNNKYNNNTENNGNNYGDNANNSNNNNNSKIKKRKRGNNYENNEIDYNNEDNYNKYLIEVEKNYQKLIEMTIRGNKIWHHISYGQNRIWHGVCENQNLDVVQLIFSLKDIQPEILNENGETVFLIACAYSNLKIIKFIHKIFPSIIHSQTKSIINGSFIDAIYLVTYNRKMNRYDKLKTLHYLYLNGINIHFLRGGYPFYKSIYSSLMSLNIDTRSIEKDMINYFKVISEDFDYLHIEHDLETYKKPSFWKEIQNNESKQVNEWKNRFEEHVLCHLSKMIQEHMLKP